MLVQENKQSEFAVLLQSNKNIIWTICNKYVENHHDREDLFQDIAMGAWESFHSFRNECKFSTWLYRVSLYKALERIKSLPQRIKTVALNNILFEVSHDQNLERKFLYRESLSQLTESELRFILLFAQGYSYKEMSIILNVNENNLRVRMGRIKQRLKEFAK